MLLYIFLEVALKAPKILSKIEIDEVAGIIKTRVNVSIYLRLSTLAYPLISLYVVLQIYAETFMMPLTERFQK